MKFPVNILLHTKVYHMTIYQKAAGQALVDDELSALG